MTTRQIMDAIGRHPILTATFSICLLGGVFTTIAWAPDEWGLPRQIFAGVFGGAGVGFLLTAPNLFEEVSEEVLNGQEHEIRSP